MDESTKAKLADALDVDLGAIAVTTWHHHAETDAWVRGAMFMRDRVREALATEQN